MSAAIRRFVFGAIFLALLAAIGDRQHVAWACPFCMASGTTLLEEANAAQMILYGTLTNARLVPGDPNGGTTDLSVEVVIKENEILAGRKTITLAKYLPPQSDKPFKYLVFCDVYKGQIDGYRGQAFRSDSHIAEYLKGALALKRKDIATRLKYFFNYLDDPDIEIANDAYMEFGNCDYRDFRPIAETFSAAKIAAWLKNPGTPPSRFGLYGSILGHCGTAQDAELLREMLDDSKRRYSSGMDGLAAGYIMLKPAEGWTYLLGVLKNEKREHLQRYAALRAARFIWEYRPDLVAKETVAGGVMVCLAQRDMADLVIEDFRKWKYWKAADRVVALYGQLTQDDAITRKAIIRFALACPRGINKKLDAFLEEMKKKDPDLVREIQEWMPSDSPPATNSKSAPSAKSK